MANLLTLSGGLSRVSKGDRLQARPKKETDLMFKTTVMKALVMLALLAASAVVAERKTDAPCPNPPCRVQ